MAAEDEEIIQIFVEKDVRNEIGSTEKCTPQKKKAPPRLSTYEEKLYALNKDRMEQQMLQSQQMHELKMKNENEMHLLRLQHERQYQEERMKILRQQNKNI